MVNSKFNLNNKDTEMKNDHNTLEDGFKKSNFQTPQCYLRNKESLLGI